MNNNLQNLVVFIKDEAELQQAREMLEANGQEICEPLFYFNKSSDKNYLLKARKWFIDIIHEDDDTEISLTELEQKLKQNRDETTQRT